MEEHNHQMMDRSAMHHDMKNMSHDMGKMSEKDSNDHGSNTSMHSTTNAAEYLKRFWIVCLLIIPLIILNKSILAYLGFEDFALRSYLQFFIATIIFYYSLIFFQHAFHELKNRQPGMMTLVSVAVGSGYIYSVASTFIPSLGGMEFYIEISTLIWVLLFGHYLEAKSTSAAGDALQEVAKLLPKEAHIVIGSDIKDVDISTLKNDDIILIKPGEKAPADGTVIEGESDVNESHISGESKPINKKINSDVVAGSIIIDGTLKIKLNRVGANSTIGQIQALISQAQTTKPSAQKVADRASRFLTIAAILIAIFTIVIWTIIIGKPFTFSLTLAITVLVIACPHALGLAIPTVSTIATSLAVKNGVFIKDMSKLEIVKKVDYVVFDKTGTLTKGEFGVSDIISIDQKVLDNNGVLQIAASLEQNSSHMIGMSIVKYATEQKIDLQKVINFSNIAGKGIKGGVNSAIYFLGNIKLVNDNKIVSTAITESMDKLVMEGKTAVILADQKQVLGLIGLSDQIKPESMKAIEGLHKLGVKVAMLTGDNQQVAETVAKQLKIDTYFAEVLPEDKYKHIKNLQEKGNKVMMSGDGVNDAPALTQADVGVAIGAGTDVAVEAGDIVLTRSNPEDIARLIILSRNVYQKMVQNLVWALGYNIIAIPAAAGVFAYWNFFLSPQIGAMAMALSSIIVVVNAMSLKRIKLDI